MTGRGLLDTSVFIANELGRRLDSSLVPQNSFICVVTLAELQLGVLAAKDTDTRARRLRTFEVASTIEPLPVDATAAAEWARLRYRLFEEGRRANINDLWIASVALAHEMPVVTQDGDFESLVDLGGPDVILV
ncbi:MAG: type II toxin-antitoxin system VapC family toxin [Aeromicrobium sp.]